ncbi:hypothetical protein PR202_gb01275 [Eleusine coracana subsp. coracana]|uniref:AP2/ERF domain-containing protein n=1 Tax=Eleusine coracana subsp. coracana TaxID=191504 RepID=A0AAV5DV92_ELECO|nr:hypothetical protein QOZ80_5BG0420080 [Eleusine coracana subsp. coracana]GJN14448.1 hypothetical protein PR202_gb01275 [Eleusine coracana subsp. coracana]
MNRPVAASGGGGDQRRCGYKGVRRRRWGKWVSEIRVPGTRERLWLGSYAAPEAAAVAHDAAACLLRGHANAAVRHLNFPERAACYAVVAQHHHHQGQGQGQPPMSPRSVQRVASDAGMAADAQLLDLRERASSTTAQGVVDRGGGGARGQCPYARPTCSDDAASAADGSRSSSAGTASEQERQLVYGDISVDDIEILY